MKLKHTWGFLVLLMSFAAHAALADEVVSSLPADFSYQLFSQPKFDIKTSIQPDKDGFVTVYFPRNKGNVPQKETRQDGSFKMENETKSCKFRPIFNGNSITLQGLNCTAQIDTLHYKDAAETSGIVNHLKEKNPNSLTIDYIGKMKVRFHYEKGNPVWTEEDRAANLATLKSQIRDPKVLSADVIKKHQLTAYETLKDGKAITALGDRLLWEHWTLTQEDYLLNQLIKYIAEEIFDNEALLQQVTSEIVNRLTGLPLYENTYALTLQNTSFIWPPTGPDQKRVDRWMLLPQTPSTVVSSTGYEGQYAEGGDKGVISGGPATLSYFLNAYIHTLGAKNRFDLTKEDVEKVFARFSKEVKANENYAASVLTDGENAPKFIRSFGRMENGNEVQYIDSSFTFLLKRKLNDKDVDGNDAGVRVPLIFTFRSNGPNLEPVTIYPGKALRDREPSLVPDPKEQILSPIAGPASELTMKSYTSLTTEQLKTAQLNPTAPGASVFVTRNWGEAGLRAGESGTRVGKTWSLVLKINQTNPQPQGVETILNRPTHRGLDID